MARRIFPVHIRPPVDEQFRDLPVPSENGEAERAELFRRTLLRVDPDPFAEQAFCRIGLAGSGCCR